MPTGLKIALFSCLDYGGAKRYVHDFVMSFYNKHQIDLYTLAGTKEGLFGISKYVNNAYGFEHKELLFRKPLGFLNRLSVFFNQHTLSNVYRKIATEIDKRDYDIVFVQPTFFGVPALLKYLSTASIYYCHEPRRAFYEPYITQKRFMPLKRRIYEAFLAPLSKIKDNILNREDIRNIKCAKMVLTNSYYTVGYIHRVYGVGAQVCYTGVDTGKFKPLGIPKENIVLSVGQLELYKAHDFVILVLGKIAKELRPKLIIVCPRSDREEKEYLIELARRNNVELDLLENINDEDLVILYNKAKLVICAFMMEPFGLIPLESMACSTPVVAVDEGGLKETILHDKTGLLLPRNIDNFSVEVGKLLEDNQRLISMGQEGRKHVLEHWMLDRAAERLEDIFVKVARN